MLKISKYGFEFGYRQNQPSFFNIEEVFVGFKFLPQDLIGLYTGPGHHATVSNFAFRVCHPKFVERWCCCRLLGVSGPLLYPVWKCRLKERPNVTSYNSDERETPHHVSSNTLNFNLDSVQAFICGDPRETISSLHRATVVVEIYGCGSTSCTNLQFAL